MSNDPILFRNKSHSTLNQITSKKSPFANFLLQRPSQLLNQQSTLNLTSEKIIEKVITNQSQAISHYKKILSSNLLNLIINPLSSNEASPKSIKKQVTEKVMKLEESQHKELLKFITPPDDGPGLIPCELSSYKFLLDLQQIKPLSLMVPQTFISGHGFDTPTLIYTENNQLRTIQRVNLKALEILVRIFNKQRAVHQRAVTPIAVLRMFNSICNKVIMRNVDLKAEIKKVHKKEVFIQRYIVTKGNLSSKFRVVFRDEQVRVYRVTNKARIDKRVSEDEEKSEEVLGFPEGPGFKQDNLKKRKSRIFKKMSFGSDKEGKLDSLEEFLESVQIENVSEDLKSLYSDLAKFNEKTFFDESEVNIDDLVSLKILNKLKKMFLAYSKEEKLTRIVQFKSLANFKPMIESFVSLKDTISKYVLLQQNKKISVFMCDFFEDSKKNVFFSQIKYCKCVESLHIPLKIKQKQNHCKRIFKCPGKYCSQTLSFNQVEVFAKSILMQSKKVFPKKCKILVGTMDDRFEGSDNIQKLNPRLFERTQVCKNCFQVYTQQLLNEKTNKRKSVKKEKNFVKDKIFDFEEYFNMSEVQTSVKKEFSYMDKLGTREFRYTQARIMEKLNLPKVVSKHQQSFLDLRKGVIKDNMRFDEFVGNSSASKEL